MRPLLLLAAGLALAGCGGDAAASDRRPTVVATTTQLADVARNVGGDAVDVHQILQPNTDPHEYEPRPGDVKAAAGAKVVLASGAGLDHWIGEIAQEAGGVRVVTVDRHGGDPHWWHDPRRMEAAVPVIRGALSRIAPRQSAAIARRASAYTAKLRRLDAGIAACIGRVPAGRRKLVTSHDAFGYFARRYGIAIVGAVIPSQSTEAQPSAGQISKLAALVRREHVTAIYPESSINPKLAEALARQTGARADLTLYGDTLGPQGSAGDTYLKMERANADAMVKGWGRERMHDQRDLIVARDLAVAYPGGPPVLEGVTAIVRAGMRVGVLGPNGGGKTTLLRTLLGELRPAAGALAVSGRCGSVPQTERSRLDFPVSALDVVLMGALGRLPWWRRPGRRERHAAVQALQRVGLQDRAQATFGELSGGQRQRVLVARALLQDAEVILFDEPFTGLDAPSTAQLTALVDELAGEGRAVLIATHDVAQTLPWDAVLCLNHRQVAFGPPSATLTPQVLEATYGRALVHVPGSPDAYAVIAHRHD